MPFGEAIRLLKILRRDTTSQFAASMEGWEFPADRSALYLLDLYDLTVAANSDRKQGKPKPHPGRPYKLEDRDRQKFGNTGGRSRAQVVEILNRLGHTLPV